MSPEPPTRHPATEQVARWFADDHLPEYLRYASGPCRSLAALMIRDLQDSPELTDGLRNLLRAKDAFVRAAVVAAEQPNPSS
ncbi:hypothetical protein [Embleya sp. MST-111070]|uniref:hypothetical protein n=1 Tax=Embleya sp. MST-111070 TaxID=3398231 RepID=UPI003F73FA3E